ncbi:pyruvate kinase [Mycobacterium sp. smrl_JER01]|uniref:pyruvate kinase n=1 Tax=Mycobacterium sp. smrl_JER01 TaxID=3402633 RepID=UPI003AC51774
MVSEESRLSLAHDNPTDRELVRLVGDLDDLLADLDTAEMSWAPAIAAVAPQYRASARNMVHYWAIRQIDLRGLQRRLSAFGLSSLGRSEAHVESTLGLVRAAALAMLHGGWRPPEPAAVGWKEGRDMLRRRSSDLFGVAPSGRETRIMVTLPTEAAGDVTLVRDLIDRGMGVARINCAHDDPQTWRAMARHVRAAGAAADRWCAIAMDLGGPKLRTGPIRPGPGVVRLHPRRDALGHVTEPARAWLTPGAEATVAARPDLPVLPVPGDWLARRRSGETLTVYDTRGAKRRLTLGDERSETGARMVTADRTTYLTTGTPLRVDGVRDSAEVGPLPESAQFLLLRPGDQLRLTRDCSPAVPASGNGPTIGCTLPEVFDNARPGERIFFDDGKIGGQIRGVTPDALQVRIDRAAPTGSKLRAAKGINVPDTRLPIPALTDKDRSDLTTAVDIADFVQMSFVQDPSDVLQLHEVLSELGGHRVGVVLKIETRAAFERLPQLLLTAMRRPRTGVMIARGDLAVEIGYERLAELQEEILWLCEAAHLPVIWATQVLEQLAKTGLPSRAEVSDAAMAERAECVMLNKGPHIPEAVTVLDDILCRMTEHHDKKSSLLRRLHSWSPDGPSDR